MATAAATSTSMLPKLKVRPKYVAFAFVGVMMAYVLVHNESYLWNPKDPIWEHYRQIKWYLLPHGLTAACALLLGPLQFSDRLRAKYAKVHRVIGRIYVGGALLGGPAGAIMQAVEGPVRWTILSVVDATMLVGVTAIALNFILKGNVTQHRNWMTRSYAVTLVFLEGRLADLAGNHLGMSGVVAADRGCRDSSAGHDAEASRGESRGRLGTVGSRKPEVKGRELRLASFLCQAYLAMLFIISSRRFSISSMLSSSFLVEIPQRWPNGSSTALTRSPQNISMGGILAVAPAATARL